MSEKVEFKFQRNLEALTSCDLAQCWSMVKEELQYLVSKGKLVCIPYVTDGPLYDVTSVFIKTDQSGLIKRRYRKYRPLGLIQSLLVKEKSDYAWHDITSKIVSEDRSDLPEWFELTISDPEHQREVMVVANNLFKKSLPSEFSPVRKVVLNKSGSEDLAAASTVYLVNEVVAADRLELRITVGRYGRVFQAAKGHPVLFAYQKFGLSRDAAIVSKRANKVTSKRTDWAKLTMKMDVSQPMAQAEEKASEQQKQAEADPEMDDMSMADDDEDTSMAEHYSGVEEPVEPEEGDAYMAEEVEGSAVMKQYSGVSLGEADRSRAAV